MSLGNTSIHQMGEIPEIEKLPNGRIRVTRRFYKFTREDIDNANLGSLMGDFGDLDTEDEQVSNQGYTNCRLISVEVDTRFNSVSNTDAAVLIKTYETLTNSFVQITDDTVNFTENGLKQITRVYRAVSGTTSSNAVGVTVLGTGETLAISKIEDNEAFAELTETYIESGVLSVSTTKVGGQQQVQVQAFNLSESAVVLKVSEVTEKHELVDITTSDVEGIPTRNFTFDVDNFDLRSTTDNGLLTITRTDLGTVDYSDGEVGTGNITVGGITLYLAGEDIDNGNTIKKRVSRWTEGGQISKSEDRGPDGLPNTKTVTYVSQIIQPTSDGILLSKNIDNTGGYKIYTYKYLEGETAGSAPTGTLQSYEQIIEVRKAGSVTATGGSTSSLPYIISIPPTIGKVKAVVSIELTSSNTVSVPVAYNLSDTSCSATTVNRQVTPVGVEQGGSLTIGVYNVRESTSHQPFSNYYATNTGDSGSITTAASILRDNDRIIGTPLNEVSNTVITLTGSNTEPQKTGLYDQILDPVFIDALGTQFYRKTSYTIS